MWSGSVSRRLETLQLKRDQAHFGIPQLSAFPGDKKCRTEYMGRNMVKSDIWGPVELLTWEN